MTIHFVCPHCRSNENVGDNYGGTAVPCKACGQMVSVPMRMGMTSGQKAATGVGVGTVILFVLVGLIVLLVGCGGVAVALLLPAVQSARTAARQAQSSNNMKQIMLAMHNYHDVNGSFPPAYTTDKDGKPLTSWRVLILPYLEGQLQYQQYDQNKPWDSPENLAVAQMMPMSYRSPSDDLTPENNNHTSYMIVSGTGTAFANPKGPKLSEITDGTSNTVCLVETPKSGVVWTQPNDLDAAQLDFVIHAMRDFRPGQLNEASPRGLNAGFFDGSVRTIPASVPPTEMKKVIESADGMPVLLP